MGYADSANSAGGEKSTARLLIDGAMSDPMAQSIISVVVTAMNLFSNGDAIATGDAAAGAAAKEDLQKNWVKYGASLMILGNLRRGGQTSAALSKFPSRGAAFNQAKRDLGIPRAQHPSEVNSVPMTGRGGDRIIGADGKPIMTREYTYTRPDGSNVIIQEHSAGHRFNQGGAGDQGPHFNVRPPENTRTGTVPGTQEHYSF